MKEPEFQVGDVVRFKVQHVAWDSADCHCARQVYPQKMVPITAEGVVKVCYSFPREGLNKEYCYDWCVVAIPEMRCYVRVPASGMDFIEHQPSPEQIVAMYAELRA